MWRWIFASLLTVSYTSTQPVFDHDGRECCPCPKPNVATPAPFARSSEDCPCANVPISNLEGSTRYGDDQALASSMGDAKFARMGPVDDCPCRFRDADSVGAPSVFLPSAVRALWPSVSKKESKGDVKPLLHPEVGLASSVLETLREATDEEYQEAIARDAVRSTLQVPDVEAMSDVSSALDTARNIVNVLFKPDMDDGKTDDTDSEASHVQESRVHPLGRSRDLNLKLPSTKLKKEPINLLRNNIWDMDSSVGASNVNERIVDDMGKNYDKSALKANPSLLNLFPGKRNEDKISKNLKQNNDESRSVLDDINFQINNSLSDLKLKIDNHLQSIKTDNADKLKNVLDSIGSPSVPNIVLKPIIQPNILDITTIKPYPFKSLLNFKDVELIPAVRTSSQNDFNIPRANIPNLVHSSNNNNRESTLDLFKNFKSTNLGDLISNGLKIGFKNMNGKPGTENIQPIPKGIFKSNMKDTETSPSEIKTTIQKGGKISGDCNENLNDDSLQNDDLDSSPKFEIMNRKPDRENVQPISKGIFKSNMIDAETSPSDIKTTIHQGSKSNGDFNENINDDSLQNDDLDSSPKFKNTKILENVPEATKINKENLDVMHTTVAECQINLENNNSNNLSELENNINTEIIDTLPSASNVQPVELANENLTTEQEDFNNISRSEENNCQIVQPNEEDVRNISSDFEEKNRDDENISNIENDQENSDIRNKSENLSSEAKDSEENCITDTLNEQDSAPAASGKSQNVVETDSKLISDAVASDTNDVDSNEYCVEENENKFVKKVNPLFKKSSLLTKLKEDILRKKVKLTKPEKKTMKESASAEFQQDDKAATETIQNVDSQNKPLDIHDIQKMSDKLLDLSSKRDQESDASENTICRNSEDTSDKFKKVSNVAKFDDNSLEDFETKPNVESEEVNNKAEINKLTEIVDKNEKTLEKQPSCTSKLEENSNSVSKSNIKQEMTADGSEPIVHRMAPENMNEPFLLNKILHPNLENFGINLNRPIPTLDEKFNLKLPSLDDVKENLASIFQPKDNFGFFNINEERVDDDSNRMSVDSSAPKLKSVLPTQPWEDVDLDIFQLRPLTLPAPQELLSKLPRLPPLNLNSYKAKLAVPKGFNLKPMKLKSSLGGKNGLLGATLTVGSNKGSKLFNDPLNLNNIPTLEELHSNLRENAQNFFITPLDITGKNILDDSLRSSQTLTDNIRSHAKHTVNDIHKTLETTLRDVKQSDLGILAEPFKDPKEFLQAVSRTHEDVTDKLKGIQYDLNDRLESIRDRITDQSLLPTLNINAPMMRQSSLFGADLTKEKPTMLSSSYRKPDKKFKTVGSSKSQGYSRVNTPRKKPVKSKNMKQSAAPSIPVPKTVEAPKLRAVASSSPPPFLLKHPSFRIPQLLANKKSFTDMFQKPVSQFRESKIPVLGSLKPKSKVKISFGSTTLRPVLSQITPTPATRPSVPRKPVSSVKLTSSKNGASRIGSKLRPSDSNGATSILAPIKLKSPAINEEIQKQPVTKTVSLVPQSKSLTRSKPQNVDNKFTNGHAGIQFSPLDQGPLKSKGESSLNSARLSSPKNTDILSSLREAVKVRLSNITPLSNDKIVQPEISSSDMLRSASENIGSTDAYGCMRENSSYTCKMICTRNN